jgi:hypothetical protein
MGRQGRPTNKLLQFLLDDEEAKKKFIELMSELGSARDLYYYFQKNTFYGNKYYLSWQTICNVIRRLGFKGRRGRNRKNVTSQNRYSYR